MRTNNAVPDSPAAAPVISTVFVVVSGVSRTIPSGATRWAIHGRESAGAHTSLL